MMEYLPTEVVLKILSYLNTYDLLQFCKACGNTSFLKERHLVRLADFSRKFELQSFNLCKFITTDLNYSYIKVLNIDYIYWIPAVHLRKLIKKLENLEVLHAVDTKLGIKYEDIDEYVKLKKLAVSIEYNQFEYLNIVSSRALRLLESLCLKIVQRAEEHSGIYLFLREIKHLEELWIYDDSDSSYRIDYSKIVVLLKKLKKLVIKSKGVLPYYDFRCDNLFQTFECKRNGSSTELIFEKVLSKPEVSKRSIFEPRETEFERAWEVFGRLHKDLSYGPKESKQIYLKQDIKSIFFEDLNFCHAIILCNSKYINAALQILSSKNSTKLKRLSFRSCLFRSSQTKAQNEPSGFKRPRIGCQINSENHPFRNIADNLKCLKELEISTCPGCVGVEVISAYPLLEIFVNLQKLTLEIPLLMDGSFLKQVFMKCQQLESLNLICTAHNEVFMLNVYQNLKYAGRLRDFRLTHKEIVIDKLLNCFMELEHKKILRIFLKCDSLRYTDVYSQEEPFTIFMKNNPQLVFFLLIVSEHSAKKNSSIQKIFNTFKTGNPAKVFYVKNDIASFTGVFPVPAAHRDMIFNHTNVSVINVDEF